MEDYRAITARNHPKLRESCAPQHRNFLVGLERGIVGLAVFRSPVNRVWLMKNYL